MRQIDVFLLFFCVFCFFFFGGGEQYHVFIPIQNKVHLKGVTNMQISYLK